MRLRAHFIFCDAPKQPRQKIKRDRKPKRRDRNNNEQAKHGKVPDA